ncbi:tapasin-related protein [Kryptolebias marmoratus]|uniref:Dehydrogenase/reductase (SDR family) member 13b.2 n=1 Tax=Kryptolebias marmoratus TaxID=37003 RepID=A0A3Q3G709_KRYMA|nr:tapasin-related protein [Kryptolebias marmoratus]XP_017289661.1 tapasin-related protein [Kryptolebias marmoratus]
MSRLLKKLIYIFILSGVHCDQQIQWLSCQFTDEHVAKNLEGHTETQLIHRQAMLQFGQKGDAPLNPHTITFLIIGSKLDLRRYVDGVEAEQLECELRRYSTEGIHVHWPSQEAKEYNWWFTCTLKHSQGLFTVTGFLRHPSDHPPPGQQDYNKWPPIADTEKLTTTVAMVVKTQTPSVKATLGSEQKLHCQFSTDHRGANVTVEWHWQNRGERIKLFSHTSRTGKAQGSGVGLKALAGGDASYTLPFTKMKNEGSYICSVHVNPLLGNVEVNLHIEEPPRVSLNVGPILSLLEGSEHKVICEAENYYPLDVEIVWYEQDPAVSGQRIGAPLPKVLPNILLSSHKHNQDMTYSLSAFFFLQASLKVSERQFICSVSHRSLRMPIKKSFILKVEEPTSWMFILIVSFVILLLLAVLVVMLRYLHSARKPYAQKKPY